MDDSNSWPQPGHKWEKRMREIDELSRAIPYLAAWRANWTDTEANLTTDIPGTVLMPVFHFSQVFQPENYLKPFTVYLNQYDPPLGPPVSVERVLDDDYNYDLQFEN